MTPRPISSRLAEACATAKIDHFLDKTGVRFKEGLWGVSVATGLARCSHLFLIVSANMASGKVVVREPEQAMQRWIYKAAPNIVCAAEPDVASAPCADPSVPLVNRLLVTFCPRMAPSEAAAPSLVKYVTQFTMRQGRLHDWMLLLSPVTFGMQTAQLPGISAVTEPQSERDTIPAGDQV